MKKIVSVLLILPLFFGMVSCEKKEESQTFTSFDYFHTVTTFVGYGSQAEEEWNGIKNILENTDKSLSYSDLDSDVGKFNATASGKIEISYITFSVLKIATEYYQITEGYFNPAMGILSDLWGFGARFEQNYIPVEGYDRACPQEELPNEKYIELFLPLTDFSKIILEEENQKYYVIKPDLSVETDGKSYTMMLDLSGIGKGYAADLVRQYLKQEQNTDEYYLSVGTSTVTLGQNRGKKWNMGIKDPRGTGAFASFEMKDSSLSTSGDYENYYVCDGKRYCHILDPYTGKPSESDILSVTCSGQSAAVCDLYSTAMFAMGYERARIFAEKYLKNEFVCIVYRTENGVEIYSQGDCNFCVLKEIK